MLKEIAFQATLEELRLIREDGYTMSRVVSRIGDSDYYLCEAWVTNPLQFVRRTDKIQYGNLK